MRDRKLYLGIDGGGTRTTALVVNAEGGFVARAVSDSINFLSVGMERARDSLRRIAADLAAVLGPDAAYDTVFIGNSALNAEAPAALTEVLAGGIFACRELRMHGDAYIALLSFTLGEPGILIISGTGSVGIAGDGADRPLMTAGGWGHLFGDEGSAYHIALRSVRAAAASLEKTGPRTALLPAARRWFGIAESEPFVERLYHPPIERHVFAGFAAETARLAEAGDAVAQRIVRRAADDLAKLARALARRLRRPGVPIGASGGVLAGNEALFRRFQEQLGRSLPLSPVTRLELPPECGAVFACFRANGQPLPEGIRERLRDAYLEPEVRP